jgi:hypothetical protein
MIVLKKLLVSMQSIFLSIGRVRPGAFEILDIRHKAMSTSNNLCKIKENHLFLTEIRSSMHHFPSYAFSSPSPHAQPYPYLSFLRGCLSSIVMLSSWFTAITSFESSTRSSIGSAGWTTDLPWLKDRRWWRPRPHGTTGERQPQGKWDVASHPLSGLWRGFVARWERDWRLHAP